MDSTNLKTIAVFFIIVGCFVVLFPKLFYPLVLTIFGAHRATENDQRADFLSHLFEFQLDPRTHICDSQYLVAILLFDYYKQPNDLTTQQYVALYYWHECYCITLCHLYKKCLFCVCINVPKHSPCVTVFRTFGTQDWSFINLDYMPWLTCSNWVVSSPLSAVR
ncbi:hypothetical protein HELRODRAFT_162633 [Helobdella robusta]|uniref:Uncharacterized protein n=1 Tax=Helobdella robusta TaxID=6412 RepID=T1ESY2_HELRO|nr:hypothetical protein HELRODRAFT_162633 [Helobdella robusta]ESN99138.1 hypothetical protein HELRODRAFT_162633 [Helobdella robusta]